MGPYLNRDVRDGNFIPDGLVRMDRAAIYLKNRTSELLADISTRTTKSVGDYRYRVSSFAREMLSLGRMSGEQIFIAHARDLYSINERTPRLHVISRLQELHSVLEVYEAALSDREEGPFALEKTNEKSPKDAVSDANAVFVIMPFRQEFNDVWTGGIKRACEELGLNPIRVDMINRSTNITDDIVGSINSCHIAIADVTDNNPNVMFELGYAIAKSKPNIIISQSSDYLPFDIRHLRTIVYANSWSGIEDLKVKLMEFLKEAPKNASSSKKITKKVASSKVKKVAKK